MPESEFNLKSSTIEKGLEIAKDFLDKLISPTIEEVGLLISDNIKYLRFKSQVRILLKAKDYVEKKKINLKEIPIKILVPLLENASLEENEKLQDKWSNMLVNMVNSDKNFQNQIFPYILNQISIEEFDSLKEILQKELEFELQVSELEKIKFKDPHCMTKECKKMESHISYVEQGGFSIYLREHEISNLLRLELINKTPPKIYIQGLHLYPTVKDEIRYLDANYDYEDFGYRITELGKKFIEICELESTEPTSN